MRSSLLRHLLILFAIPISCSKTTTSFSASPTASTATWSGSVWGDGRPCPAYDGCPDPSDCGMYGDGCGGSVQCGDGTQCTMSGDICGGGGSPNWCGKDPCMPATCAGLGKNCGQVGDLCGNLLNCGACTPPEICGASVANVCGMPPPKMSTPISGDTSFTFSKPLDKSPTFGVDADSNSTPSVRVTAALAPGANVSVSLSSATVSICGAITGLCDNSPQGTVTYSLTNVDCKQDSGNGGGPGIGGKQCLIAFDATFNITASTIFTGTVVLHYAEQWTAMTSTTGSGCGSSGCSTGFPIPSK